MSAKIPRLNSSSQRVAASAPVAQTRFRDAGIVGRAKQQVGRTLQNLASTFSSLETKRRRAENAEFRDTEGRGLRQEVNDFTLRMREANSGTDHKDFEKNINKFMSTRAAERSRKAPSSDARNGFMKSIGIFRDSKSLDARTYENREKARFFISQRQDSINGAAISFQKNPNPFDASLDLDRLKNEFSEQVGVQYNKEQANGLLKNAQRKYRNSVVTGLIRDGLPGVVTPSMNREQKETQIDLFLRGGVPGTETLFAGIQDTEVKNFRNGAINMLNRQEATFKAETKNLVKNASEALLTSTDLSPRLTEQIDGAAARISQLPDSDEKEVLMKGLVNSKKINTVMQQAKFMSNKEISQVDVDAVIKSNNLLATQTDNASKSQLVNSMRTMLGERNKDGAAWVQKNHPNLSVSTDASLELQKDLGIPNPRVLTKEQSGINSRAILSDPSAEGRALKLDQFIARQGDHAPQAMKELLDDNKDLDPAYMFATYFDSTNSKETVIRNSGMKKAITKEFGDVRPGLKSSLDTEVQSQIAEASQALADSGNIRMSQGLRSSIGLEASRLMVRNPELDLDDAVSSAKKTILDENFSFFKTPKSTLILPRSLQVSVKTLDAFMDGSMSDSSLESMGVTKERYKFKGTKREFNDSVRANSKWINNEAQDGIVLLYENKKTGAEGAVTNDNGNRIEIKYKDMSTDQRVLDNLNSFLPFGTRQGFEKASSFFLSSPGAI